jgi:integrase
LNAARDAAGLPESFTPYNARHTGISWAIDKGVDLQKVRQRAGHGSLEVTSRYAAILDERDTSLADALEEIFDTMEEEPRESAAESPELQRLAGRIRRR